MLRCGHTAWRHATHGCVAHPRCARCSRTTSPSRPSGARGSTISLPSSARSSRRTLPSAPSPRRSLTGASPRRYGICCSASGGHRHAAGGGRLAASRAKVPIRTQLAPLRGRPSCIRQASSVMFRHRPSHAMSRPDPQCQSASGGLSSAPPLSTVRAHARPRQRTIADTGNSAPVTKRLSYIIR